MRYAALAVGMIKQALLEAAKADAVPTVDGKDAYAKAILRRVAALEADEWLRSAAAEPWFILAGLDQDAFVSKLDSVGAKALAERAKRTLGSAPPGGKRRGRC